MAIRLAIFAAALLSVCACTMQTDVPAPATYVATKHPRAIWVESATTTVRVDNPQVEGATIVGVHDGRPFSVLNSDLTVVSVRRIDWVASSFIAAGTGLVVYAVASANHPTPPPVLYCIPNMVECGSECTFCY